MKKLIFSLFLLLISFQAISAVTYEALTEKAKSVLNFFIKNHYYDETNNYDEINRPNQAIMSALDHFNQKNEVGTLAIPIYIQKINNNENVSPIKKYLTICEKTLLGYSWEKFKTIWNSEKLRKNNDYLNGRHPSSNYIDNITIDIANNLRQYSYINKNIEIPVIENDFNYINSFDQNWASKGETKIVGKKLYYHIKTNRWLNESYPTAVPFQIAHELAGLERNSKYICLKNLLTIKTALALGLTGLLSYATLNNGSSSSSIPLICGAGTLTGVILGNLFKGPIKQQEALARDSRAKELCKAAGYSNKDAMDFFYLKGELEPNTVFSDATWDIKELKINMNLENLEHPTFLQSLQASQPSPAQRMRNYREE